MERSVDERCDADSVDALLADFDAAAPLHEATTIPGSWYTDPRIERLERSAVWGRNWQMVARASQLTSPGQYVTAVVGSEPIVVVRGRDSVLRAFYNVCRHHAAAVCTQPEGHAENLRCPYHGWTYGLDGRFKSAPELEGVCSFDPAENSLVPISVDTWENFVFVNLDLHAPTLTEHLGGLVERVRPLALSQLQFAGRREWIIPCNWKVFVDNYLDGGYHIPFLHRSLNSILSFKEYTIETFEPHRRDGQRPHHRGGAQGSSAVLLAVPQPHAQLVRRIPRHEPRAAARRRPHEGGVRVLLRRRLRGGPGAQRTEHRGE